VVGKVLKLLALRRLARLGPFGFALATYGAWRQLSPEDKERVRRRVQSLRNRVGSGGNATSLERRAWPAGEA